MTIKQTLLNKAINERNRMFYYFIAYPQYQSKEFKFYKSLFKK